MNELKLLAPVALMDDMPQSGLVPGADGHDCGAPRAGHLRSGIQ